jgi:hypothetical protein
MLLLLVVACAPRGSAKCDHNKSRPDIQSFPIYPGGRQVQIRDPDGGVPRRVIEFSTDAKPEEVSIYYKNHLEQHGWEASQTTPGYRALDYVWTNHCVEASYWLLADITTQNSQTVVVLDIRTIAPE